MTHFFTLTPGIDNFTGLADDFNQFQFTPSTLQSTDTVTGGAAGSFLDILVATAGGTISSSQFQGVTLVEQLNLSSGGNNVTLSNSLVAGSSVGYFAVVDGGGSDTINASTITSTPIVFFAGAGNDAFTGGGGNDAVFIAPANLTSADTFQGGPGADNIYLNAAGTVSASAFTNVSGFEGLSLSSFGNTVTLTNGLVTGASYFSVNDGGGNDSVDASAVTTTPIVFFQGAGTDSFTGGGGHDAVYVAVADLTSADSLQGGAGVDNLYLTTAGTVAGAAFTNVTGFEGLVLSGLGNNVTLTNGLVAGSSNGVFAVADGAGNDTVDASGVTNASSVVVFASSGADTFKGGNGLNGYSFAMANLTSADTVVGGSAVDNLVFTTAGTLAASAFTNVTGIEAIQLANGGANHVTLTNGLVAGTSIGYFAVVGGTNNDTVDAGGITNGTAIVFNGTTGGNDGFGGGNGNDSFQFAAGQLTAADNVAGGGGADTLWMTTAGTTNAADLAGVSGIEGVFLQNGGTFNLANGITAAAGLSATGSSAVDNFNASTVTTYSVSFTGNGGADSLTGGSQNDKFFIADSAFTAINGNGGIDRITLTAPAQSFNLTANAAKITNLEVIDLDSSLNSTLTLAGTDIALVNAGGTSLYVVGDVDDTVNAGNGYTQIASGVINNAVAPGHTFYEYQHSSGSLLFIDTAITAATATTGNGSASVPEGTAAGATVFDAQQAGATTYVLGGADAALFSINGTGKISFNASPDFETALDQGTNNVYDLTVTSSNGTATPNFVETVAITVTDVNDNAPAFTSGAAASTPENVATTTPVYTAQATDADAGSTVSYALAIGGDNDLFDINTLTGEVTFKVSPNFEAPTDAGANNVYNITVHASDGTFDTPQAVAITVTDVNAAPVFTSGTTGSEAENTPIANVVYDANATDDGENNNTLTYSLSAGGDNDFFNINAATGEVTFKVSPNFEAPLDAGANNVYDVTVHANDGTLDTTRAVAISVTDVNAAPVFTSGTTGTEAENTPIANVVYDANATDDGENTALTYSLSAGGDNDLFNINAATGEVTFKVSPNFEAPADAGANNVYDVTVHANDGAFDVTQAVAITVTDVNAAPVFTSGSTGTEAENTPIANVVYDANATDDGENAALTYSLSAGGDNDLFDINAATGEVTFKVSPNFEAPADAGANNVYDITVHANDGGFDVTQGVAITVTDVNAAPVFTSGTTGSEAENTPIANVVYDANATDDGENTGSLIYSLSAGGDNDRFDINAATGEVTFKVSPNFEAPADAGVNNVYDITVHANDGGFDTTQAVAITVTNVNAAPVFTSGTTGTEAENTPIANVVYDANATDDGENNNTLTYSLSAGGDNDRFNINAATGEVTFKVSPNFEAPADAGANNVYDVTVHANDGTLDTPLAVAISVTNVNEEPQTNNVTATGNEDPTGPNYIPITLTASDVDAGDTIASYHVTSLPTGTATGTLYTDAALTTAVVAGNTYAASGGSLTLYFSPAANSNGSVTFNAAAIDNHGLEDATPATETINVTAVNDGPVNNGVPGSLIVQSGFAQPVTGLSISDVDAGSATNLTTTLASAGGTITVGATAGVIISGSGTGSVTLTGSVTTIDNALAGSNVKFTATDGAATPTTTSITITTNDAGNTGVDPGLTGNATSEQDSDTIQVAVTPQVWFIDINQTISDGTAPRGSQANPFTDITEFNGSSGPGNNDYIYLKAGTYNGPGINLKDGQTLLGDDQALSFSNPLGGTINIESASGARPTIHVTTAGDQGIDVASSNTIRGINIQTDAGNSGLDDGTGANNVGTLTVSNVAISGVGKAVDLDGSGTLAVTLESISSTGATADGIDLTGMGGSLTVTGGTTVSNAGTTGIHVQNSTAGAAFNFGNTNVAGAAGTGVDLASNAGNVTFADLDINGDLGARSFLASGNTGTITTTSGTIVQDGGGGGFAISGATTLNMALDSISVSNTTSTGIDLSAVKGSLTVGTTTIANNTLVGVQVLNSASGSTMDFGNTTVSGTHSLGAVRLGTAGNGNVGNITFDDLDMAITGPGVVATANTGITTISAGTIGTGTGTAIDLTNNTGGTFNLGGGTGGVDITTTSGTGFNASAGATLNVTGASNTIQTGTGQVLNWNAVGIGASNATFASLQSTGTVANNTAVLLSDVNNNTFNGGAVTIAGTSGATSDGIRIDQTSSATFNFSSATISNTGDDGIDLNGGNGAVTFSTVNINGAGGAGIETTLNDHTINISGGTIGNTNDPAGVGVDINGGGADVTVDATINKTTAGHVVEVSTRTNGIVDFNGNITSNTAGGGIDLTGNTGGTTRFDGGMTLSTGANTAFNSSGGNTGAFLVITDPAGAANNVLTTTTGTALNVANTTIGVGGLTFESISANGGTNGIVLNNTGATAGLTVTGTGAANSGGTIQNMTGADNSTVTPGGTGIVLNNTRDVVLNDMLLHDFSNYGIRGNGVINFTMDDSTINGVNGGTAVASAGTPFNESSISFDNLTGTAVISDTAISGGFSNNVRIVNSSGSLNVTFDNVNIGANSLNEGNDGIGVEATGAANLNVTVQNSDFTSSRGDLFALTGNGTGTTNLTFTGNTLSNNHAGIATGGGGITLSGGAVGTSTFNIQNNTFRDAVGNAVTIVKSLGPGNVVLDANSVLNVTFNNNTIGVAAIANSGSKEGSGIAVTHAGGGKLDLDIINNDIFQYNNAGMNLQAGAGLAEPGSFVAEVASNLVSNPGNNPAVGSIWQGFIFNSGVTPGDSFVNYLTLGGDGAQENNFTNSGRNGGVDMRIRARQNTDVNITANDASGNVPAAPNATYHYTGGTTDGAAVATFLAQHNLGSQSHAAFDTGEFKGASPPPPSSLMAANGQGPGGSGSLTSGMLAAILAEAVHRWSDAGLTADQTTLLHNATLTIGDLSTGMLASTSGSHISIDLDAAGWGWFVDPTPADNVEFGSAHSATELAAAGGEASGHVDLLTTVMHELGHVLGLEHSAMPGDLMDDTVELGIRRLPDATDVAQANGASAAQTAEAALPLSAQAAAGTPIVIGTAANDTIDAGHGGNILFGGAGADTFVFGSGIQLNAPTPAQVTHIADYSAAQGDTFDFSAITSAFHNSSVSDALVVRAVEDASGTFATLQVNHNDPMGLPSAPNWVNVAQLDGAHAGDTVNILIDNHSMHLAQIHVDLLV